MNETSEEMNSTLEELIEQPKEQIVVKMPDSRPFEGSRDLGKLFTALSKAQGATEGAKKDNQNTFFAKGGRGGKYADLHSCWEAIRKSFSDNELSIIQLPKPGNPFEVEVEYETKDHQIKTRTIHGQTVILTTILAHSSGQWISNTIELKPSKTDPQGIGSAMTYARRYGLMSISGIAPEDDDGNAASDNPQDQQKTQKQPPVDHSKKVVNPAQVKRLVTIAGQCGWDDDSQKQVITSLYGLNSRSKLNCGQYDEFIKIMQRNTPEEFEPVMKGILGERKS